MHVTMKIKGRRSVTVRALVDTGASFSVVPHDLAERIGLVTLEGMRVKMADGRVRKLRSATAMVTVAGRTVPATILVSPNGGDVLLGVETLETLGLSVDPRHRKLKIIHSAQVMAA